MKKTLLYKKVYGCLAGGAIGDNLGRPVEGWNYDRIEREKGMVTDPWPEGSETHDVGTDDTALGQILCHTYIEKQGRINCEDYAKMWLRELDPMKYWFCMKNTYELLKMGVSPRLTGVFNVVTGSGLMAIAPVGLFNTCDPESAYIDAIELASMFQRDLDVYIPAVISAAIAEAMRPEATVDSVIDCAIRIAPDKPFVTFDKREPNNLKDTLKKTVEIASKYDDVFSVRQALYENVLQWAAIDPQEVFALTFGIFKASKGDTRMAMIGGANIGRDADTISNLNGALCGTLNGVDSIPKEWVDKLERAIGGQEFVRTAGKMTELIISKTLAMEKQAQQLKILAE
jgi:ADP-ribosylglycohydrolase